jgi:hypothetical protein
MHKLLANRVIRDFLAVVGTATLVIGACYTMVQQSTRLATDDLPLSTAQTIKVELENGATPNDVVPSQSINLRGNNNVFAIITDESQHVVASSAVLDAQSPLYHNRPITFAGRRPH